MPRQNRPVVRDGRIQAPPTSKKRTERSYLQPQSDSGDASAEDETVIAEPMPVEMPGATLAADSTILAADPKAAFAAPPLPAAKPVQAAPAAAPRSAPAAPTRQGGVVRALQQQGVRKRSDVDLDALARRDTSYAVHELRRIAILTIMVVVALVVLTIVLR